MAWLRAAFIPISSLLLAVIATFCHYFFTTPQALVDPLEKDKQVHSIVKPGRWRAQGTDRAGNNWSGYLIVEHDSAAYLTKGFFEWSSGGLAGGHYHFEGSFNASTRLVRWTGFTIKERSGSPGNAVYEAILSPDGFELVNGSWYGGIATPGTWNARFVGEE
jgi:hypothetical protein